MWTVLAEFGIWILLVCVVLVALLWFGPFLLLRSLWDKLTGRQGLVERALDIEVRQELTALKRFSGSELATHPDHGRSRTIIVAGRQARFTWGTSPNFNDQPGTIDVVLEHELYLFNIAISPKSHGVDGFKITPEGKRVDLTPLELEPYD